MATDRSSLASPDFGWRATPRAVTDLEQLVSGFVDLDRRAADSEFLNYRIVAGIQNLCSQIRRCEETGVSRDEIVGVLEPVSSISPLRELGIWPDSFCASAPVIDANCTTIAAAGSLEWILETHALDRSIAQRHRAITRSLAARVLRAIQKRPGTTRIFSIASGSGPNLGHLIDHLPELLGEDKATGNEPGPSAMAAVGEWMEVRPGQALKAVRKAVRDRASFDLILAAGLFDYLPAKEAIYMIRECHTLLAPGGTLFFTNIAEGNPYRPLVEYIGEWFSIERAKSEILRLCEEAGVPWDQISINAEGAGLTLTVDVTRRARRRW